MFGRLSPPIERNRSITFSDGKGMKKSRNLQEIAGESFNFLSNIYLFSEILCYLFIKKVFQGRRKP